MIDKFDLDKDIPEEEELLSYVYSLAEELGLLTIIDFDDKNTPYSTPSKENIYQFKSRYNNNELNGSFKYEGYIKNKEIQGILLALGLDSEKFWFLLLFVFDYTNGFCKGGVMHQEDPKEQVDKLTNAIAENIKEFNQFSNFPIFHNEIKLTLSIKGKRNIVIDSPIALNYILKKCYPNDDLEKQYIQKFPNGISLYFNDRSTDELNNEPTSIKIYFFAKTFLSFFKFTPQIKGRKKKGNIISFSKYGLISRLVYFTGISDDDKYESDGNLIKGIISNYKNYKIKATNNIYWH